MAEEYDRTDLPDENKTNFYVDDFGESMRQDEALPELGEEEAFYEQAPDDTLNQSYTPSDQELGLGNQAEDIDYDPLAFRQDEDEAI